MSRSEVQGRLLVGSDGWSGAMSEDPWAEWEHEPESEEEVAEEVAEPDEEEEAWVDAPDVEESAWEDVESAVDERRPAKYARLSDGAKASPSAVRTTEAMPGRKADVRDLHAAELRDPWAVLSVPEGTPGERGERAAEEGVGSERDEQQPAAEGRVRNAGKLSGWSSAEQVVEALAAIGMAGIITKREDIRVRIEQARQKTEPKPKYVVYQYPTTRAILVQGKLADTVRTRLAEWQAGQRQ